MADFQTEVNPETILIKLQAARSTISDFRVEFLAIVIVCLVT
jgi:hypothetical protein